MALFDNDDLDIEWLQSLNESPCDDIDIDFLDKIDYKLHHGKGRFRYFHINKLPKGLDKKAVKEDLFNLVDRMYGKQEDLDLLASGDFIVLVNFQNGELYISGMADPICDPNYKIWLTKVEHHKLQRQLRHKPISGKKNFHKI